MKGMNAMFFGKSEKVAVVTGGGGGIGAAISEIMAKDGFSVAILDRDLDAAEALARELNAKGGNSRAFLCDISSPKDIDSAFDSIMDYYGRIDVLANNAGAGGYLSWMDMTMEQWHRLFSVNCSGAFLCIQRAAKEMIRLQIKGKIILTLSQASFTQDEDIVVPYCTSKWGARGLMRSAAAALAPHGITVNGVCPGTVWTPMMEGFCMEYVDSGSGTREDYIKFIERKYPTGRLQTAEDIAAMYSFLVREGHHITGQSLLVAGGIAFS